MKRYWFTGWLALLLLILLLAASGTRLVAQDPQLGSAGADGYGLGWYSIDGGGVMNSGGGSYTLSGTAGQPDAGEMTGGAYGLVGGFWAGAGTRLPYRIYLPLALR